MMRHGALLTFLLVMALACLSCSSSQQTGRIATAGPTPSVEGANQTEIEQVVLESERKIWEAFKAKDANGVDALLAEEAHIVTPDGRFTKPEFMRLIPRFPEIPSYSIDNAKVISPSKDIVILTYESRYVTKEPEPRTHSAYQTTVWINRGGKWIAIFNQETPVPR